MTPPLTRVTPEELNGALRLHPCVYSLHAPDGHLLTAFATGVPEIFQTQMRYWRPHLAHGCVAIQWNGGVPAVSYGGGR
jgi:hypothetical protein